MCLFKEKTTCLSNVFPDDHKSLCYGPKTKTCDDFLPPMHLLRMRNRLKVAVVVEEVKSEPVYQNTWDNNKVLQHLKIFPCLHQINLRDHKYKLTMLCALVTGQRCQSLHLISLDTMEKGSFSYWFVINALVKQSACTWQGATRSGSTKIC